MDRSHRVLRLPRPSRILSYIQARRRALDIDVETVTDVLDLYGLKAVGHIRNLPVGRRNRNLDVDTSSGRKLLKAYRPQWHQETVRYGHSIVQQLAQGGFPAPRLCSTADDGQDFVLHGDAYYALFDYVPGAGFSGHYLLRTHRRRLMEAAGETLALFHRELKGFQPDGRHHMGFPDYTHRRRRDVAWHAAKLEELGQKSRRLTDAEAQHCADLLGQNSGYMLEEIERLDAVLCRAPLPRMVIHGDYGLHNLLFQPDGRVTVVDFELSRLEWRVSDLVSCLSRYRYGRSDRLVYDFASMQWFMDAYQAVYPLSSDEWQLLPQVWRFYKMQSAVQYWNSYVQTNGPVRKLYSALDAIGQVEWARNYPHKLVALNSLHGSSLSTSTATVQSTLDYGEIN